MNRRFVHIGCDNRLLTHFAFSLSFFPTVHWSEKPSSNNVKTIQCSLAFSLSLTFSLGDLIIFPICQMHKRTSHMLTMEPFLNHLSSACMIESSWLLWCRHLSIICYRDFATDIGLYHGKWIEIKRLCMQHFLHGERARSKKIERDFVIFNWKMVILCPFSSTGHRISITLKHFISMSCCAHVTQFPVVWKVLRLLTVSL